MPSKSTSPEAAQKRVWKAELADLTKAEKSVTRDAKKEIARIDKECAQSIRTAKIALDKYRKAKARSEKFTARELSSITRRIGILKGRVHG